MWSGDARKGDTVSGRGLPGKKLKGKQRVPLPSPSPPPIGNHQWKASRVANGLAGFTFQLLMTDFMRGSI